ncbi:cytochrome C oxidase subunit IV family protein [Rapidithrix thailandica]|uniref:Cytochrome C oxidase subunit IV family protein n=1 Tax=Rapidithrix thailandica TaxID=413964 RepID=A0AAW9RWS4_9BACT
MAHDTNLSPEEQHKKNVKHIIFVALLLFFVTVIEFILAFIWPDTWNRELLNGLFVALTLVKAFYIVAEFMHLKHEVKTLIWSIGFPTVFIIWLLVALVYEGEHMISF